MPPTVLRSYSKINLGLRIGPPRADGFHHLTTLYQTLELHDVVTVEARRAPATEITLSTSDVRVPCDGRNTAYRMVAAALDAMSVAARVHIHLEKRLPMQGGMGAGSANAAAALLGLERQLGQALPGTERLLLAERIGSDVPLFLVGGSVYGHHRGERVVPYPDLPETACLIVSPLVGSSTPAAFRAWDERMTQLTPEAAHGRLDELSRAYTAAWSVTGMERRDRISGNPGDGALGVSGALDGANAPESDAGDLAGNPLLALVRTGMENDFEEVVFRQHPSLCAIKHAIAGTPAGENDPATGSPALCAMLSGSGSSLFGLFRTVADAEAAERRVRDLDRSARTTVTRTIGRERYWNEMFET